MASRTARKAADTRDPALIRTSKTLSWLLRHGAAKEGLAMRPDGFAFVKDVINRQQLRHVTMPMLEEIVSTCPKQRFALSVDEATGERLIRANQGHSLEGGIIDEDKLLVPITDPAECPVAIHGTYMKAWEEGISKEGLRRGARHHIHFAAGEPGDESVKSGFRPSCQVLVYLNTAAALAEKLPLFRSANNVILSPGLPEAEGAGEGDAGAGDGSAAASAGAGGKTGGLIPLRLLLKAVDIRGGQKKQIWPAEDAGADGAGASAAAAGGAGDSAAAAGSSAAAAGASAAAAGGAGDSAAAAGAASMEG